MVISRFICYIQRYRPAIEPKSSQISKFRIWLRKRRSALKNLLLAGFGHLELAMGKQLEVEETVICGSQRQQFLLPAVTPQFLRNHHIWTIHEIKLSKFKAFLAITQHFSLLFQPLICIVSDLQSEVLVFVFVQFSWVLVAFVFTRV